MFLVVLFIASLMMSGVRATVVQADAPTYRVIKMQAYQTTAVFGFCIKSFAACRRFHDLLSEIDERYGPKVTVVSVEASTNAMLMDELHIFDFPTIIVLKNGVESRWEGKQKLESGLHFVVQKVRDEMTLLTTATQYKEYAEKVEGHRGGSLRVVGYFPSSEEEQNPLLSDFSDLSADHFFHDLFTMARLSQENVMVMPDGSAAVPGTFSFHGAHLPPPHHRVFATPKSIYELRDFLVKNCVSQMEEINEMSFARFVLRNKTIAVMWHDETSASAPKYLEMWQTLQKRFGDVYTFGFVKSTKAPHGYATALGIDSKSLPAFVVINRENGAELGKTVNYPATGEVSVEALARFLETAHTGTPTHMEGVDISLSQPVPSDPLDPSDGFMKAVASTVEGMVFDATKRMTLVMYAPEEGCVKCAAATLMIRKLRDRIPSSMRDSVSFVKFDPTKNAFSFRFNPTFMFPEFAIRNGTTLMTIDPRLGSESTLEDIMKNFVPLEATAMKTGHHAPEWRHPKDRNAEHHHHTSPHDCHSNHEVQFIVERIDEAEREIRSLYRFVYGTVAPEGFIPPS